MRLRFLVASFGAILIFSSGVAVGQKAASSRFEKYEGPARLSEMEWRLVQANLETLRGQLEFTPGIGLPFLYYDHIAGQVKASSRVNEKYLGEQKISEVQERLLSAALQAQVDAGGFFPEVEEYPDPGFEVEFYSIRAGPSRRFVFAEFKQDEIVLYGDTGLPQNPK